MPVYLDISKLKSNEENYFHFSSNVLSHGNFTGSSVDLYSSFAAGENLNSFLTQHPYCDEGWMGYSDRNINVRLELYAVLTLESLSSFLTRHQYCDENFAKCAKENNTSASPANRFRVFLIPGAPLCR